MWDAILTGITLVVLAASSAHLHASEPVDVHLSEGRQRVLGWGFGIAPTDWDGTPALRDHRQLLDIARDSRPDFIKLFLGNTVYDPWFSEASSRVIPKAYDSAVGRYVRAAREAGIKRYVLALITPPKGMKEYYSDAGHLHLDGNTLRPEYTRAFVDLLVAVLAHSRMVRIPMPYAISVQDSPDMERPGYGCPRGYPQGCMYSSDALHEVVRKCRVAFARRGFNDIKLIGPDTYGKLSLKSYLSERYHDISAATIGLEHMRNMHAGGGDALESRPIWAMSEPPARSGQTADYILAFYRQLERDLVEGGGNYWVWPYGYCPDDTGEGLYVGPALAATPALHCAKAFWDQVERGGRVCTVGTRSGGAVGFAVAGRKSTTVVIINEHEDEVAYRISDARSRRPAATYVEAGEDRKVNVRRAPMLDGVVVVAPKAVVIAVLKP